MNFKRSTVALFIVKEKTNRIDPIKDIETILRIYFYGASIKKNL